MLANAGKDTVFKVAAGEDGGARTNLFYTWKGAFIAVMAFALLVVRRAPLIQVTSLAWGAPLGVLVYATYMLALRSLVHGEASTNITVFRLNFVVTSIIAALALHETLTIRKLAGLVLCLAAILVFFWGGRESASGSRAKGILLALAACFCCAALNTLNKVALNMGASIFHLILYRYIVVCLIGGTALAVRRQSVVPSGKLLAASAGAAVLMLTSLAFILTALSASDVTLIIPISQLSFLFTALLSFLLLRERLNWVKAGGIALAVVSIAVIG
jgi:drug/metabolite transporter (DMT)-like permease